MHENSYSTLRPVHNTPDEFENGGLTLKSHQMFSVHATPEEFQNAAITSHFGFVFDENSVREIMITSHVVSESSDFKSEKPAFSNPSGLKSVFEKHRFHDSLVFTVGLSVERKLRFQIPLA